MRAFGEESNYTSRWILTKIPAGWRAHCFSGFSQWRMKKLKGTSFHQSRQGESRRVWCISCSCDVMAHGGRFELIRRKRALIRSGSVLGRAAVRKFANFESDIDSKKEFPHRRDEAHRATKHSEEPGEETQASAPFGRQHRLTGEGELGGKLERGGSGCCLPLVLRSAFAHPGPALRRQRAGMSG